MAARSSYGITAMPMVLMVQLLGVAVSVLMLIWCIHFRGGLAFETSNKSLIFNVHPVLMFIGFIFVASEAILVYKVIHAKREVQKTIHLLLLAIAIILGAIGLYAVFKFHNESHIKNLYSLHSWLGLGTICLFGLQWFGGFLAFVFPGASKYTRANVHPWHIFFGLFVFSMAIVTAETGLLEKLTFLERAGLDPFSSEAMLVNSTALIIVFFGMFVVLSAILPA